MNAYYRLPGGYVTALQDDTPFPPLHAALRDPNGLIAIGGTLSRARLLAAYRAGIFPWYSPGQPVFWWSPDPRMVLFPQELRISRSLAKRLRKPDYEVRFDTAFRAVIEACAETPRPGQEGTWIVPEMVEAYCELHQAGYAHSVETWMGGTLAGGLYGVAIGGMFYGESMFHRATDASKIALVHLVRRLQSHGFGMIDCQMHTPHLARMGAREIPRVAFAARLAALIDLPHPPEKWHDTPE
ncbi:MAG: leucyl/phenylalanyl-tRNA--protein transferase [Methylophilaceae bacterium]|nr:leucyl/phenylalanyl-tRNA--protein transferase [Methylophilaceae bacterium]